MKFKVTLIITVIHMTTICHSENNNLNPIYSQQESRGFNLYEIRKHTISSGGGMVISGNYLLTSSIGQIDATNEISAGNFKLRGGFLSGNTDLIFKNGFE